ncbi:NYN domain-containing protein [Calothrix sp. CCY 0018]|uniref:NYN domain-containing protein n=1 Tax=Calothrix sp. CCY 0018 TaxID=3103864 RepID=UPI0039C5AB9D
MHDDLIRHSQTFNTVILYDIENLTKGNNNPQFNFSLEDITQKIKRYNLVDKIAGQYAYADWSNNKLSQMKKEVQQLGIEPIQIFGFSNHKNAADIQLVIDAVELIHSKPSLEVFAIVSGDGGFSCLVKKLHEYGKIVIGCSHESQTNNIFVAVCDYFIRLPASVQQNPDEINNCTETAAKNKAQAKKNKPKANKNDYQKVLAYLKTNEPHRTSLKQSGIDFSILHKVFKEQISGFDYKQEGFSQFQKFLNSTIQGTEFKIVCVDKNTKTSRLKIN